MNKHVLLRIESEDTHVLLNTLYLAKSDMRKNIKRLEDMRFKYMREYDKGSKWITDRIIQHTELRIKKQTENLNTLQKYIDTLSYFMEMEDNHGTK